MAYWASTFIRPSGARKGKGNYRSYTFSDAVAAITVARLRKAGYSLQALRKVARYLARVEGLENPLAEARLVVWGSDVLHVKVVDGDEKAWSLIQQPGQAVFGFVLDLHQVAEDIRDKVIRLQRSTKGGKAKASTAKRMTA